LASSGIGTEKLKKYKLPDTDQSIRRNVAFRDTETYLFFLEKGENGTSVEGIYYYTSLKEG
jgi:hypothetical protein